MTNLCEQSAEQMSDNVVVIIRSANERTEALCVHLVEQQIPADRIILIHERPFTAALRRSYELGIEHRRDWTLCVDADVLIQNNAISDLLEWAKTLPDHIFSASGYVYDKLRGDCMPGGLHLYRTALLEKAISYIPDISTAPNPELSKLAEEAGLSGSSDIWYSPVFRPETYVKGEMKSQGYDWARLDKTLGLHDFEQYFRDIFRKTLVRAQKSPHRSQSLLKRALAYSQIDPDFLVASWGLRVGMNLTERIELDAKQWERETDVLLLANDLCEKESLSLQNGQALATEILTELSLQQPYPSTRRSKKGLSNQFYTTLWKFGWFVTQAGLRIQRAGNRRNADKL